jgi:hypothetical protein
MEASRMKYDMERDRKHTYMFDTKNCLFVTTARNFDCHNATNLI